MADIAQPIVPADRERDLGAVLVDQCARDRHDVGRHARADIECLAVGRGLFQTEDRRVGHIVDIDEIARLAAVLEDIDSVSVFNPGREDGQDARVRVRQRLAGSVDVLIAEGNRGDANRGTDGHHELFLHLLGDAVDGRRVNRRVFGRPDQP